MASVVLEHKLWTQLCGIRMWYCLRELQDIIFPVQRIGLKSSRWAQQHVKGSTSEPSTVERVRDEVALHSRLVQGSRIIRGRRASAGARHAGTIDVLRQHSRMP
jgi:hypothetical protein